MFVLGDSNPVRHIRVAWVNYAIVALCVAIFLAGADPMVWGLYPIQITGGPLPPELTARTGWERLFAHMLLHGDLLHLGGNLVVLWVFGNNIEDATGHWRYPVFFVLCGLAGGVLESVMTAHPLVPIVGASGAIAGVMGAYLLLHPRARLLVLVAFRFPVVLPASLVVGLFVASDLAGALLPEDEPEMLVAWWAHIGGFLAGMALILVMRHRDVPLFQPAHAYPETAFGRLGRWLPDFAPRRRPDGAPPPGWRDRAAAIFKTAAFLVLMLVLMAYF